MLPKVTSYRGETRPVASRYTNIGSSGGLAFSAREDRTRRSKPGSLGGEVHEPPELALPGDLPNLPASRIPWAPLRSEPDDPVPGRRAAPGHGAVSPHLGSGRRPSPSGCLACRSWSARRDRSIGRATAGRDGRGSWHRGWQRRRRRGEISAQIPRRFGRPWRSGPLLAGILPREADRRVGARRSTRTGRYSRRRTSCRSVEGAPCRAAPGSRRALQEDVRRSESGPGAGCGVPLIAPSPARCAILAKSEEPRQSILPMGQTLFR